MIDLQNHNTRGFTLIETLIALSMMAVVSLAVFTLQQSSFGTATEYMQRFARTILMHNRLVQTSLDRAQKKEPEEKKVIADPVPATTITLQTKKIADQSSLKGKKHIMLDMVSALWSDGSSQRTESMVTLRCNPEKKES